MPAYMVIKFFADNTHKAEFFVNRRDMSEYCFHLRGIERSYMVLAWQGAGYYQIERWDSERS